MREIRAGWIRAILTVIGGACIVYGCSLASPTLAWVVAGVLILADTMVPRMSGHIRR